MILTVFKFVFTYSHYPIIIGLIYSVYNSVKSLQTVTDLLIFLFLNTLFY